MSKVNEFIKYQSSNNIDIYISDNTKFKTNYIQFLILNPLDKDSVSKNALLPYILYRGSKNYPSIRDIKINLDELYGADLSVSVIKRGELQILNFAIELVNEKYLPGDELLLEKALQLINDIIVNPLFTKDFFSQEKEFIVKKIKSLVNDKYSYSLFRCQEEMCSGETYSLNKLGIVEDYQKMDFEDLKNHYENIIEDSYMMMFLVGDLVKEETFKSIDKIFNFKHKKSEFSNPTILKKDVKDIKEIEESLNVNQGKLVLGCRTGINKKDDLYYPLVVYNGILGSFPHSKLFQNVREKSSLAYYASSSLESTKGLLMINSGIEFQNYAKAKEIILKQLDDLKEGNFSEEELEWTKKSLVNGYQSSTDDIRSLSAYYLLGLINKTPETFNEAIEKIKNVSKDDVIKVGESIKLDTIYFLNKKVNS
ncbi:EF-P 5-aminopentanol modification-associated protein YfmF [Natronospora cellulosivora (SeqCode)]